MAIIVRLLISIILLLTAAALLGGVAALNGIDVPAIGFTPSTMSPAERGNIIFAGLVAVTVLVFIVILGAFRGRRRRRE
jgi:uncharacterized metal-binding protein